MSLLMIALLLLTNPPKGASVRLGDQTALYRVSLPGNNTLFPEYSNNGYEQKVRRKGRMVQLQVRVRNAQLASKVRGRKVTDLPEEMAGLQKQLNQASHQYLADQVLILGSWLRSEVHYNLSGQGDQSVSAVLQRDEGNCVGLANLALLVLRKMDVKARYVTGLAWRMEDATKVHLEGDVLHRWIEVFYPDVGWVFCDPAGKVNFVEATYVVLGVETLHPLEQLLTSAVGSEVELLSFKNGMRTVGHLPGVDKRLRLRPNRLFIK